MKVFGVNGQIISVSGKSSESVEEYIRVLKDRIMFETCYTSNDKTGDFDLLRQMNLFIKSKTVPIIAKEGLCSYFEKYEIFLYGQSIGQVSELEVNNLRVLISRLLLEYESLIKPF